MLQSLFAVWRFTRGVLSSFWAHWGPVIMMFTRTLVHLGMALVLVAVGLFENLVIVFNWVIYVLDRLVDLLEDILDLMD